MRAPGDAAGPADLFARLDALGATYALHHHRAVFTVAESQAVERDLGAGALPCRNLFLRDKKGAQFLVTAANSTTVGLKTLAQKLGCKRLSFASAERLWDTLGTTPGSVSPFAVMNDARRAVPIVLDAAMMEAKRVAVHPLDNTMTVTLAPADLVRFIESCDRTPTILAFPPLPPSQAPS